MKLETKHVFRHLFRNIYMSYQSKHIIIDYVKYIYLN